MITVPERPPLAATVAEWVRWGLLVVWVGLAVIMVTTGEREGRLTNLEAAIASGEVSEVRVNGAGALGREGMATQTVHWRDGNLVNRYEEVTVYGEKAERQGGSNRVEIDAQDLGTYLQEQSPDLKIERTDEQSYSSSTVHGWGHLPTWFGITFLLVNIAVLIRLVASPQRPYRATRWAWFWLWCTPIGTPLYLVLSGPSVFLPTPAEGARRLTGIWAFLLFLFLT
ncbi:hypothetical protein [Kineosporia babensis]|uniref:Uncharacterized protein n=1 Tax=Kineosporia babensis TaxID=499548 RepID=A0A9X1NFW4_9ACTN|nr:hypothetical protein [Kineosporia babensis]MCD5313295.1 hypothetical protein [Kineosporia babensis]